MRPEDVEILIVCEGRNHSLDERVLSIALGAQQGVRFRLTPSGAALGVEAVCQNLNHPRAQAVVLKDRDYGALGDGSLFDGTCFRWRRHEVENFLIDPTVLHEMFEQFRREDPTSWIAKAPSTLDEVRDLLRGFARQHVVEHVAKALVADRQRRLREHGLRDVVMPKPLPTTADTWGAKLREEMRRIEACRDALARDPAFDPSKIEGEFHERLREATDGDLLGGERFLREMAGKNLFGSLFQQIDNWGAWRRPQGRIERPKRERRDDLQAWLLDALRRLLVGGHRFAPDDFGDLWKHLRDLAQGIADVSRGGQG